MPAPMPTDLAPIYVKNHRGCSFEQLIDAGTNAYILIKPTVPDGRSLWSRYIRLMAIRLYDSVWVMLAGHEAPRRTRKNSKNPAEYMVGDYSYDIDGRPIPSAPEPPVIIKVLSLQAAQELGLSIRYEDPQRLFF